jgi:DNA-binding transcriptional LysR family regulator
LSAAAAQRAKTISIACAPSLASTRLPNILAKLKARHPKIQVSLRELTTSSALELLREQQIEFFLGPEVPDLADFQFEPIAADPLFACVPASLDDGSASVSLAALSSVPLIMLSQPTALRATLDQIAAEQGLKLNVQFEVQQAITAIALAAADLGVAIMPRIATLHPNVAQLRLVPVSDALATRKIGIATLKGSSLSPHAKQLLAIIRENIGALSNQFI